MGKAKQNKWERRMLAILGLTMFLFSGCQATPKNQAVVSKRDGTFEANTAKVSTRGDEKLESEELKFLEKFTSTDESVKFTLNIEQTLDVKSMPVVEVVPHYITSEDSRRVAQILLGNVAFYERETSTHPIYSKAEYLEMIERQAPYANIEALADLLGGANAAVMQEYVKFYIGLYTQELESAPDKNPHTPCDWQLKKERVYNDDEFEIGNRSIVDDNDVLYSTCQKDGIGYDYMVVARDKEDYKLNRILLSLGGGSRFEQLDMAIYRATLCRTEKPTNKQIDEAKESVQQVLDQMELGDWQVIEADVTTDILGTEPEYVINVTAIPVLNGVPAVYGQLFSNKAEDYIGTYAMTGAKFMLSANGDIVNALIDSPMDVKGILNDDVAVLSVTQLMERAKEQLSLSDAGNYGLPTGVLIGMERINKEKIKCLVDISEVEVGLGRMKAPDTSDSYYYVPVFVLKGTVEYCGEDSGIVYWSSSDYSDETKALLWINAVDGSIIHQ